MDEQKKNERGLSVGAHGDVLTDVLDVGATAIIESLDRGVYAGKEPYLEIEGGLNTKTTERETIIRSPGCNSTHSRLIA